MNVERITATQRSTGTKQQNEQARQQGANEAAAKQDDKMGHGMTLAGEPAGRSDKYPPEWPFPPVLR